MGAPDLASLRRYGIARSLFEPVSLARAIDRMGFVQADPIRAPARAQDLILHQRVRGYRAGDLERRYGELDVEEDAFLNYGFVAKKHLPLMHPRTPRRPWDATTTKRARAILAFVRERGEAHPREVDEHFAHGRVKNYWGGSSNASTHLLDGLHYRGLLRVVRRDSGVRVYATIEHPPVDRSPSAKKARAKALLDIALAKYAPLPAPSLGQVARMLRYGAPQLASELLAALARARRELPHVQIGGVDWFWPEGDDPASREWDAPDGVRLLAPFDPVVWDRRRFELFWGWAYRFEAYTPPAKRKLGYYALPMLRRDCVIGWATASVDAGKLDVRVGYVSGRAPRDRAFSRELEAEIERLRAFLL